MFEVCGNDSLVWSQKEKGRFPEITELKRRARSQIALRRGLGHIGKKP
ncbi:MAG: Rdx family protein [Elainellaceae cyanobacterium]